MRKVIETQKSLLGHRKLRRRFRHVKSNIRPLGRLVPAAAAVRGTPAPLASA